MGIAALDAFHLLLFLHNQVVEFPLTADFDIGDEFAHAGELGKSLRNLSSTQAKR